MKLKDIIYKEEFLLCEIDENTEISALSIDPNKINENCLLIVPKDETEIKAFADCPPVAVICGIKTVLPDNIPAIRVENPRSATSMAYYRFEGVDLSSCILIGITGTNGKSSTAKLISETLTSLGHKVGVIGTGCISIGEKVITNNTYSMTTPDPDLLYPTLRMMINEGCGIIVMEVSSHALALDKVSPLRFDYGIFTNLSNEHMDFHKSRGNYFEAKKRLFDISSCAVINIDDPCGQELANTFSGRKISVGILYRGNVYATDIEKNGFDGINYNYHGDNFSFKMRLNLPGSFNVYNSMIAATVCIDIGEKPCRVKECMSQINQIPGRFFVFQKDITVVIDYAHTDIAFYNILKELSELSGGGKLTSIFGCGGQRDKEKRPRMAKIAEKFCDNVILTTDNPRGENPKEIINDIIKGFEKQSFSVNEDRADAIRQEIFSANPTDIIAILGKGIEKYFITANGYEEYDEIKIVREALNERENMHYANKAW